jgi:hypothetical protein
VRSSRRRRSAAPAVRQLQDQALAAIGSSRDEIAKWTTPPTVAVHFGLVGHGYEMQIFVDGHYMGSQCRDFSDTHKVDDLKSSLITIVAKAVNDWRMKL